MLFYCFVLRNRCRFEINLYLLLLFEPGTNKIKYCFENSNEMFWVAGISAGLSLEGHQTIF